MPKTKDFIRDIKTIVVQRGMDRETLCNLVEEIPPHLCRNKNPLFEEIENNFSRLDIRGRKKPM